MMNPAVYAARKVEKHARAAIDAATGVEQLVKASPTPSAWEYVDLACWRCREVARAAESLTDLLDPEKAENDPEIFRAHIRLTDIAKRVCAAADSLVALADARNHTIRR